MWAQKTDPFVSVCEVDGWGLPVQKQPAPSPVDGWGLPTQANPSKINTNSTAQYDEWGLPLNPQSAPKPADHNKSTRGKGEALGKDGMLPRDAEIEGLLFAKSEASGINFKDYDNIPVSTTGQAVPQGIDRFATLQLAPSIMNSLQLAKYDTPTPIQKHAIPAILQGRDVKASAQV